MLKVQDLQDIQKLKKMGMSRRAVARALAFNRRTVTKYWDMKPEDLKPTPRKRKHSLEEHQKEIERLFKKYRNCTKVHEELVEKYKIDVSLRTLQVYVRPLRQKLESEWSSAIQEILSSRA